MKNLKIYKKGIKLAATTSIVLLAGCAAIGIINANKDEYCNHLILYYDEEPITYKECEGYDLIVNQIGNTEKLFYQVEKDGRLIIYGISSECDHIQICHKKAEEAERLYNLIGEPKQKTHVK